MSKSKSIQDESQAIAWLGRFEQHAGPRYMQIADFVERGLADGRLKPGDRLPPQRRLALLLQVDLTTVTRGYDEARRRNLLEGQGARGTYAATPKVELAQLLDLSMNIPPPPDGIDFDDLLKQGLAQVLLRTDSGLLMNYHLGGGSQADRAAGAAWLAPMLGRVDEEQVVVCPGAQSALAALILTLSRPGDIILAEPAVYPGLRTAVAQLGRRVQAVEVDAAGMLPDALEKACGKQRVALLYLNPTLQNPTTHTMPAARRREIARVAARCGVQIIEDDPYWLLAGAPPPPLAHYAPRQVSYISTLSKCLAPGLRTAFVLLSDPQQREAFMAALRSFVLMPAPLTTALTTQWIHDGSAQRLLAGVKEEARKRQLLAHQLLAGKAEAGGDGIHVWLPLPGYWTAHELARAAQAEEGLAVTSSEAFYAGPRPPNAIRISLGSIRDSHRLAAALRKLSQLLARKPSSRHQALI
ncbi:aminotransferase-like domain-containing protein [Rugamonas rivuli]|uniref:aminotransferase-like domain-containing protein n=1 Tax=Rugamonas rivuli TaxID=2743358 RepID=UPI00128C6918|nr:PLP-dependent aminotransferase family protein [Rugamonas rivuli]